VDKNNNEKVGLIIIFGLIIFVAYLIIIFFFSNEIPGDWLEKNNYKTTIDLNLFKNSGDSKNYHVKGEIEVSTECESYDEKDYCGKLRLLKKAIFPDAGYITFDDCEIELGKKFNCFDDKGEYWYIEVK
jgi:hypothetical protein